MTFDKVVEINMNIQDLSALLASLVIIVGLVGWFFRLESKTNRNSEALEDYKDHCEQDRIAIKDSKKSDNTQIWEKINDMQTATNATLSQILSGIGELKGRMDERRDR
jgi:hypothetical protein